MNLEQYQKYCNDLKNTAIWGGQLEVLLLLLPLLLLSSSS